MNAKVHFSYHADGQGVRKDIVVASSESDAFYVFGKLILSELWKIFDVMSDAKSIVLEQREAVTSVWDGDHDKNVTFRSIVANYGPFTVSCGGGIMSNVYSVTSNSDTVKMQIIVIVDECDLDVVREKIASFVDGIIKDVEKVF